MTRNIKWLIALIVVFTIAGYAFLVIIPSEIAERSYAGARSLGNDIREALRFTPEIKVNNTIVLHQQTAAFELAVLEQNFEHRYAWQNSWLGSTKKIFISGSFKAKAGFDLGKKFSITLRDDVAYVTLPAPGILSVESLGNITYRDEQGIWNWVNMDDRTRATNAFIRDARRYASSAAFVDDAKTHMEKKLEQLLKPYADKVVIDYQSSTRRSD